LGVDLSEAMVNVASTRINARAVDFMAMDAREGEWDVVFSGSNVYQYFPMNHFENAIKKTARMIRPGGYFFGDFITPDHIRWYPHIFQREDVVSLRLPKMVVKGHHLYHQNEIVNVSRKNGRLRFIDGGKHQRYLPSLLKVRLLFNEHFRGSVDFYDAVSLVPLGEDAETTLSTRYLVVARKAPNGQEPRS
ncbi:MAG: class I SAM-dependent methyltransferase, partial [Proteobacteria bacterium]|nr:class I SAM-dependent methyltransferase [Pseudomonadota bacterium]